MLLLKYVLLWLAFHGTVGGAQPAPLVISFPEQDQLLCEGIEGVFCLVLEKTTAVPKSIDGGYVLVELPNLADRLLRVPIPFSGHDQPPINVSILLFPFHDFI